MRYLILLFFPLYSFAQVKVEPQVINSAGKSFQKPNAGVTFTVGEIMVKSMRNNNVVLTNSVVSSGNFIVTSVVSNKNDLQLKLFPNPANQMATFQMGNDIPVLIKVTNINGSTIFQQNLPHSDNFLFDVSAWTAGMYILSVYDQHNGQLGFIKFQKL